MATFANASQIDALNARINAVNDGVDATQADMDVFWLILGGALVFLMQAGFGMLEAGSVRSTSVVNIVFKNLMDSCIGAFMFYMMGYALAYGDDKDSASRNGFVGNAAFFLVSDANGGYQDGEAANSGFAPTAFASWFFQFAFCATAATIVSGAVAERLQLKAYFAYSAWICGFVYPVVVHWTWSSYGWASPWCALDDAPHRLGRGLQDFAGSGIVHMCGGFSALAAAFVLGPRRGKKQADGKAPFRFGADADPEDFVGHNKVFQTMGMFILWTGWFGFNCVSTLAINEATHPIASRAAVTTMLGAAGGGLSALVIDLIMQKVSMSSIEPRVDPAWQEWAGPDAKDPPADAIMGHSVNYDLTCVCNGVLAGLVSITAGCSLVEPWAALLIGMIGGGVFHAASHLMCVVKIDDPLDAFAVHGACGYWGLIAVGLFGTKTYVHQVYDGYGLVDHEHNTVNYYGAFHGGDGKQLGIQLLVGLVIAVWSATLTGLCFLLLKAFDSLRVPDDEDSYEGVDKLEHSVEAYSLNHTAPTRRRNPAAAAAAE